MNCIKCKDSQTIVIDSRLVEDYIIKRRRECRVCGKRFNTLEKPEISEITVIKKNGSNSVFDREKIKRGIFTAFNNIDYDQSKIIELVDKIENDIRQNYKTSIKSSEIGDIILKELININEVAYIRFASVYNKFDNIDSFIELVNKLKSSKEEK